MAVNCETRKLWPGIFHKARPEVPSPGRQRGWQINSQSGTPRRTKYDSKTCAHGTELAAGRRVANREGWLRPMRLAIEITTCNSSRTGVGYYTEHLVEGLLESRNGGDEVVLLSKRMPAAELA